VLEETVGRWLDQLGSAAPTPGGGGVAALSAATAAGLVEMVANLSTGRGGDDAAVHRVIERATELRYRAAGLADADATAFGAVMDSYKLPRGDDAEKAARRTAMDGALAGAARVPLDVAAVAAEVLDLARDLLPHANPNVLSDIAVAAATARAAVDSSVVNVEVNLALLKDAAVKDELTRELGPYATVALRQAAEEIVAEVRGAIAR
jgi:methenyltetrahydrofolate cyclohydrolase